MIRGWSRPSTAAWSTPRRRWGWRWGELGPVREAHTLNQFWHGTVTYTACKYRRNQKKISFSPHVRWDCQLCPLSLGHLGNAFLPSSNHFLLALNNRNENQVDNVWNEAHPNEWPKYRIEAPQKSMFETHPEWTGMAFRGPLSCQLSYHSPRSTRNGRKPMQKVPLNSDLLKSLECIRSVKFPPSGLSEGRWPHPPPS